MSVSTKWPRFSGSGGRRYGRRHDGELREPGRESNGTWLIPGVLSSRIRLTQDNRARESELLLLGRAGEHPGPDADRKGIPVCLPPPIVALPA